MLNNFLKKISTAVGSLGKPGAQTGATLVQPKLSPVDFNQYFDNASFDNIPLEFRELGMLNLPTGNVVACDPLVGLSHTDPFTRSVAPGKYSVVACIAQTPESGDRYAAVRIAFSNERAATWQLAVTASQDISVLKSDEEYFGYPVDAGLGCFCDLETQATYAKFLDDFIERNPDGNIYDDYFAALFKVNAIDPSDPGDIGNWLNFHLPNQPDLNVVMFSSGYGDGAYPCYWGIADNGKVCSLIVDFQVF